MQSEADNVTKHRLLCPLSVYICIANLLSILGLPSALCPLPSRTLTLHLRSEVIRPLSIISIGFQNKVSSSAVRSDIKHNVDQAQNLLNLKQFQWKTSSPYRSQVGSEVLGFGGTCEDLWKNHCRIWGSALAGGSSENFAKPRKCFLFSSVMQLKSRTEEKTQRLLQIKRSRILRDNQQAKSCCAVGFYLRF